MEDLCALALCIAYPKLRKWTEKMMISSCSNGQMNNGEESMDFEHNLIKAT